MSTTSPNIYSAWKITQNLNRLSKEMQSEVADSNTSYTLCSLWDLGQAINSPHTLVSHLWNYSDTSD